jgi:hypothetical protein
MSSLIFISIFILIDNNGDLQSDVGKFSAAFLSNFKSMLFFILL